LDGRHGWCRLRARPRDPERSRIARTGSQEGQQAKSNNRAHDPDIAPIPHSLSTAAHSRRYVATGLNHTSDLFVSETKIAICGKLRTKDRSVRVPLLALCTTVLVLAGCDQTPLSSASSGSGPAFDPIAFFTGHTHSWGVIESRAGAPTEWVVTDSHGEKDATDHLQMIQLLSFQDGTTQKRDWSLWRSGPNQFDATANDMVGSAKGEANGAIFH
jgi:hypothetical protein